MNSSHLSVVVDLAPAHWHRSSLHTPSILDLPSFISQLLAFLNAHIAARHENTLAVFGAFPGESVLLYSSSDPPADYPPSDANSFPPFKMVNSIIIRNILSHLESSTADEQAPSALVSALIKALCYINRLTIEFNASTSNAAEGLEPLALPDPRILILSVSPDQTASYIPLFGPETVFLQQAAHLTGGSYIYLERRDALLQYLTMAFLPSPAVRETISVPTQDKIDFRAACFCHKNIVDVGFVCSVCLSIFCQPVPVCSTCRTKFPIKTLQRLNLARPSLPPTASSASKSHHSSAPSTPQRMDGGAPATPSLALGPGGLPHSGAIGFTNGTQTNGTKSSGHV